MGEPECGRTSAAVLVLAAAAAAAAAHLPLPLRRPLPAIGVAGCRPLHAVVVAAVASLAAAVAAGSCRENPGGADPWGDTVGPTSLQWMLGPCKRCSDDSTKCLEWWGSPVCVRGSQ